MLGAYRQGAFPMADLPATARVRQQAALAADDVNRALPVARRIGWYSPDPRAIVPMPVGGGGPGLHVPGGLRRHVRKPPFAFTTDMCFERVIRACAAPRSPGQGSESAHNGLWLDETLVNAYCLLHRNGHAHSVEAWAVSGESMQTCEIVAGEDATGATLVGGIYGVSIGGAFFAESMFCRPALGGTNASSLCLVQLYAHVLAQGYELLDVQIANEHTRRFGVIEVPRAEYLRRLDAALARSPKWGPLVPARAAGLLKA
jgi:leucyl/phenylalanyl-tRNA---protein transferase